MHTHSFRLLLTGVLVIGVSTTALADDDLFGTTSTPTAPVAVAPAIAAPTVAPVLSSGSDGLPGSFSLGGVVSGVPSVPVPEAVYMPDPTIAPPAEAGNAAPAVVQPEAPPMSQAEMDTRMWDAARAGDTATVANMLQQGANIHHTSRVGESAMHAATAAGSLQTVIYLVNAGANINATTANGWTPLHHAARFGRADIANFLKGKGANLNATTTENPPKTPVQMALDKGDLRTARILGF
ncbi:MAG TPA: ankyrin repeat domain-containing protein [Candidatus Thiothrix moscowensis]|uniref:ankyrin repeat domain-containing protein n=1 Tax=unclassified Thiothrix TaxID=2636184 RepID=UPI001A2CA825|nr:MULTISPECIES: ankyrin repeat domain-containing protein [unclassified Thiothrix]MBJ6611493.1 ankyrin repeat domain-containing protein [Candidatus Thiothrix moscowensis]HRJ51973.1 ankyrin repeat domain-containing protein [Candidatus Thiothrix moscowensis]HRJ92288.1 ankyrin repeat domain-containing protein [Candidatus Thiothrix moscowensis]